MSAVRHFGLGATAFLKLALLGAEVFISQKTPGRALAPQPTKMPVIVKAMLRLMAPPK